MGERRSLVPIPGIVLSFGFSPPSSETLDLGLVPPPNPCRALLPRAML